MDYPNLIIYLSNTNKEPNEADHDLKIRANEQRNIQFKFPNKVINPDFCHDYQHSNDSPSYCSVFIAIESDSQCFLDMKASTKAGQMQNKLDEARENL